MIDVKLSALKDSRPHEYAMRFLFGGACTAVAGLVATRFGPGVGGLFLAFPAIFPAGASLIESHEKKRKAQAGFDGKVRGRLAAAIDARGTSMGCIGLAAFALVVWKGLPAHNAYGVISLAALAWALISCGLWAASRSRFWPHRKRRHILDEQSSIR